MALPGFVGLKSLGASCRRVLRGFTSQAWYYDETKERAGKGLLEHFKYLTPAEVFEKCGVQLSKIENCDDPIEQLKLQEKSKLYLSDWLDLSRQALPDFDLQVKMLYTEHLHTAPQIRLVTRGAGFFDVRDYDSKWIRLHVTRGDIIHLPGGVYHRFSLDRTENMQMMRLFSEHVDWVYVPVEDTAAGRPGYLKALPHSSNDWGPI